jgi:hypothetical protein
MSENTVEVVEVEVTFEQIVSELVDAIFGSESSITAYKIANVVNGIFKASDFEKSVPPQMMYNYSRNGLIVKGEKGKKQFNKTEVTEFVTRYTKKQMGK